MEKELTQQQKEQHLTQHAQTVPLEHITIVLVNLVVQNVLPVHTKEIQDRQVVLIVMQEQQALKDL